MRNDHKVLGWLFIAFLILYPPNWVMRFGIWRRKRRLVRELRDIARYTC